jgi:MFS family permease
MTDTAALAGDPAATPSTQPFSAGYTRYAMFLLLGIYIVNFLDRSVVNILAEPIKQELHLADWQLGMMSGLAFALFYTVLGIPIARLAERSNRPIIIGTATAVWSGFTMLSGTASSFIQLIAYRIGVGVGEGVARVAQCALLTVDAAKTHAPARELRLVPLEAVLGRIAAQGRAAAGRAGVRMNS